MITENLTRHHPTVLASDDFRLHLTLHTASARSAKLRGPSFVNLQILPEPLRGYKMSDVIAILGSLDFVVGEVDR